MQFEHQTKHSVKKMKHSEWKPYLCTGRVGWALGRVKGTTERRGDICNISEKLNTIKWMKNQLAY